MARTIAKDHDKKRQSILSVAASVFAREGIARASMNQVAKSAGISKANIYHYYDSKEALLFDILDSYLSELNDRVSSVELEGKPPEEQLHLVLREYLLAYEGMDYEHNIQSEGVSLLPDAMQTVLKAYQKDMVTQMSGILDAVSGGKLSSQPRLLRELTMSVFGMLNWYYMWHPKATRSDREGYARTITQFTVAGLPGVQADS
ncbi:MULTISPECIES: TetR/AcrR family transcriptional regulator [unclassified Ruegeria]|uniref:TetR/AcrR family transcriptional regulator n=1 Tax=unclassified Ruegeria TaxID=2625375 RepID=UPI001487CEA3